MMKRIVVILLLIAAPATTFAGEDSVNVANLYKDLNRQIRNRAVTPVVTEKYEYYEIRGDSEKELRSQMCQNGCTWNDGKKYDSATSWHMKWNYGYDRGPESCSADSFRVFVEIIFRYPKWVRTGDAPQPLVNKWDDYMKHLIMHENGHRDMAMEAASELSRAVAELPPAPTCAELDREVRALSRARMNKLNADEMAYDAATNHGYTQGAIFR